MTFMSLLLRNETNLEAMEDFISVDTNGLPPSALLSLLHVSKFQTMTVIRASSRFPFIT